MYHLHLVITIAGLPLTAAFLLPQSSFVCWAATAETDTASKNENDTTYYPPGISSMGARSHWWRVDKIPVEALVSDSQGVTPVERAKAAAEQLPDADSAAVEVSFSDSQPPAPLWLGCYGEGVRRVNEDNTLQGFVDARIGRRIFNRISTDLYATIRGSRDLRGLAWNNRADGGIGLLVEPIKTAPVSVFAQALIGNYIPSQSPSVQYVETVNALGNGSQAPASDSLQRIQDSLQGITGAALYGPIGRVTEIEIGAVYAKEWGDEIAAAVSKNIVWPFRCWGYLYSELVYSHLNQTYSVPRINGLIVGFEDSAAVRDNLVLYVNPKVGVALIDGVAGSMSACAALYGWIDTHQDWWNNKMWGGPLVRYRPFAAIDLAVEAGYMVGGYYGISNKSDGPNPYSKVVSTWQFGVYFDYSLGTNQ